MVISATQLDDAYSDHRKRQIVDEWVDFFASGPSPITSLRFDSRTPRRLFEALASQSQLVSLDVKWGDYQDLSVLTTMTNLRDLRIAGASGVRDLQGLAGLPHVTSLILEGLIGRIDASPVGEMSSLIDLTLGGDWMNFRNVRVESIGFLAHMSRLERVLLHSLIVHDLNYRPLLSLPNLRSCRVMEVRGMDPPHDQLRRALRVRGWRRMVGGIPARR